MIRDLGISDSDLQKLGAVFTSKEIAQQPETWLKLFYETKKIKSDLEVFLSQAFMQKNLQIILTGAGTSAFIGEILEGPMQKHTGLLTKSVATTDLVTHPEQVFAKNKNTLLISFARSGDSPESTQSIELADQLSDNVYHLIITCNRKSRLVENGKGRKCFFYFMPEESNDQSLAMTSSFTTMLLAGLFVSRLQILDSLESQVQLLVEYADRILDEYVDKIREIAEMDFNRAVFLGSGLFGGAARESHLKLQELTNGKIICKCDTFLGFRHGPKVVIDDKTLVTYLCSNESYVGRYEKDLIDAVKENGGYLYSFAVMEKEYDYNVDFKIVLSRGEEKLEEDFLTIVSVLPAQILGFHKSIKLGLKPDSPSQNGVIHRVVQGVKLYPYSSNGK